MSKDPIFTGAGVAIITPFHADGSVDYAAFGRIIDHQIAHGTDAIIVCGTTGEASTLHDTEHRAVVAWCCEYVDHRVPVIAGVGSNDTAYAIELTRFAKECGADGGLSVTPYYNKTSQRGLIAHYNAIADSCDLPIILYNVPSRTGLCFTADTLYALSQHPNINGLKAASGDFSLLASVRAKCGDALNVWSGNDDQIVPLMALGGKGVISVLSNVAPQQTHDLTQLCLEGRYPEAAALQLGLHSLIEALFCEVNPIPVKKAMELLGWQVGPLRLPLVEPSEEHTALIRRELEAAGCHI
ncbi:MAG: 4-hydroxy-tetrahydrodipicolinate synthase [Eubacteriales bacterium]|nr:4-hydroxy-tetrahydrodipicolinate synthase [Eubacteriales bacterium]